MTWNGVPHEASCPDPLPGDGEPDQCHCLRSLVLDARSWARHGYEIGQRSCTWSDHGVAPAWLVSGHGEGTTPVPAAVIGNDDDGDAYELRVRYCRDCARTMVEAGEFVVTGVLDAKGSSVAPGSDR